MAAADRPSAVGACLALATVGFVTSMGMPMVVGALIDQYGYGSGRAGYIASAEYLGMLAASLLVSSLVLRVSRQRLAAAGIVIAIASNAMSLLLVDFPPLMAVRFLSGVGCGMAYAVAVAILAGTRETVRNFMFLVFANALINVLVLYAFPVVLAAWHLRGIFLAYCAVLLASSSCIPWLPRRFALQQSATSTCDVPPEPGVSRFIPWLCLFAVFAFYMMIGGYWAFVVPIGLSVGFDTEFVAQMLSADILLSLISCLMAYRLSQRLGQSKPLLVALGLIAIIHIGGGFFFGPLAFLIGLTAVNFFWNFTDIYQFGIIAKVDQSGVFASRIQAAQMVGYVVSPASVGWLLDHGIGYPRLLMFFGAWVSLAFVTYAFVYAVLRARTPELADAS